VDLVRGDDDQDRGNPLVPKGTMKVEDSGGVNLRDLTEVNDWTAFLAQDAIDVELLKSSAQGMGLRHLAARVVELLHAREEMGRAPVLEAEVLCPILLGSGGHWHYDPFL
jgi:hypothetical protein